MLLLRIFGHIPENDIFVLMIKLDKDLTFTRVALTHPDGDMTVCTKFYGQFNQ